MHMSMYSDPPPEPTWSYIQIPHLAYTVDLAR